MYACRSPAGFCPIPGRVPPRRRIAFRPKKGRDSGIAFPREAAGWPKQASLPVQRHHGCIPFPPPSRKAGYLFKKGGRNDKKNFRFLQHAENRPLLKRLSAGEERGRDSLSKAPSPRVTRPYNIPEGSLRALRWSGPHRWRGQWPSRRTTWCCTARRNGA